MSCLAASFCNLTMVLSNFGLWFLFCLGIMASRETRRKPTAESTMLSQNQRNSSYRWLFISLTHALQPPLGVSGDGGNKTTETTPHQQSRISGCLKFLFETCHKIHFGPYLYIELWFFFNMLFENMVGSCVHWNVCCVADSAFSTRIPPGSDTTGVLSIAWGFASVDWYFLPP